MKGKRHTPEQIISKLREAEADLNAGQTIGQVCQRLGISEQTFHRWRNQYGGMKANEAKRLKELEQENNRLKKLVADLSLDNAMLKEIAEGTQAAPGYLVKVLQDLARAEILAGRRGSQHQGELETPDRHHAPNAKCSR